MTTFKRISIVVALGFLIAMTNARAGTLVQFRMPVGDIEIELYDQDKPATVQNFLRYVNSGNYKDMVMHRWEAGFVLQGGGFYVKNRFTTNAVLDSIPTFGNITNEYSVGRTFSNSYGTLAMARVGGQTNSANSQWFLSLTNNAFLDAVDGGFTVFGHVLAGTNVLNRFNNTSTTNGIFVANLGDPLSELPVLSQQPTYDDLVFVDITLLGVSVARTTGGGRIISWNSVTNHANKVEYTVTFPPVWQTLVSTNGNGSRLSVTDTNLQSSQRFYRVRLDF